MENKANVMKVALLAQEEQKAGKPILMSYSEAYGGESA